MRLRVRRPSLIAEPIATAVRETWLAAKKALGFPIVGLQAAPAYVRPPPGARPRMCISFPAGGFNLAYSGGSVGFITDSDEGKAWAGSADTIFIGSSAMCPAALLAGLG